MSIKTTLNLRFSQAILLYEAAERFDVSLSFVINALSRKIFMSQSFSPGFLQSVTYQSRIEDDETDYWKRVPVSFDEEVYEKCLDMRKIFKLSVSRLFAFGIIKYLNEVIQELAGEKVSDNYSPNYFLMYKGEGDFKQIILLWGMKDKKKFQELYEQHQKT